MSLQRITTTEDCCSPDPMISKSSSGSVSVPAGSLASNGKKQSELDPRIGALAQQKTDHNRSAPNPAHGSANLHCRLIALSCCG